MNDPRFPPSTLRRTAYFQYAACNATSQMLCRTVPGHHAACYAVTPLSDCFKFGPCQVFSSYPSSNKARINSAPFMVTPANNGEVVSAKNHAATGCCQPLRKAGRALSHGIPLAKLKCLSEKRRLLLLGLWESGNRGAISKSRLAGTAFPQPASRAAAVGWPRHGQPRSLFRSGA